MSPDPSPRNCYVVGAADTRPWGRWQVVETGPGFAVKRIAVTPGARLSLQYHHHRAERWICVAGHGIVTLDGRELPFGPGDVVSIATGTAHRIANPGPDLLEFIEVQLGAILDEDDIVRLSDDFGRVG